MAEDKDGASRRDFLKMAGTAAPAAAVAVAAGGEAKAAAPKAGAIQDTEHTRKYLETARF